MSARRATPTWPALKLSRCQSEDHKRKVRIKKERAQNFPYSSTFSQQNRTEEIGASCPCSLLVHHYREEPSAELVLEWCTGDRSATGRSSSASSRLGPAPLHNLRNNTCPVTCQFSPGTIQHRPIICFRRS